jgi:ABC-2 type transport system ATP-binding protein
VNNILEITNLSKSYEDFELKDINLVIPKGHVFGIIGENGAGKTTTIKAILNLINRNSGDIKIFGLDNIKDERKVKERIGVVLDDSFLPSYFNPNDINRVMKVVHFNWDEKLFFDYLEQFKLPKNKNIKKFSKGMLIKLKIAVSLSFKPQLLILDEPTSGLDPIARSDILDIFDKFMENKENAILISSHITTDLERLADDIIFMDEGKVILTKSRKELENDYLLVKCSEEKFNEIDKSDVIKYKKNRFEYQLLVSSSLDIKSKYNIDNYKKPSLEEIMILYMRGEE